MDLFNLVAKLGLDKSEFEDGINEAKNGISGIGTAAKVGAAAIGAVTTAVGAFSAASVKTGMDFDSAMSQVAATMGKTTDEIGELREFAQQMGSTTAFSATQAAEALNYMALAGYDSETSMKMLPNVLNLAAAGNMDLAAASDMVTDAQTALGLSLDDTETMVDQMAKTSSTTNTSVAQLGDALLTVGGNAKSVKGGTAELSAVLGAMADNGIKGSEAGTHLRNILLAMNPTTDAAAAAWEKLGVQAYNSNGELRNLEDIFTDLNKAMEGMSDQEKTDLISSMFNKTDLAAVNALLGTTGDRWDEINTAIKGAKGAAEDMADTQLDNLQGDITLMKSAFEGLQIAVSDGLTPTLRKLVQGASEGLSQITAKLTEYLQKDETQAKLQKIADAAEKLIGLILDNLDKIFDLGVTVITGIMDAIGFLIDHIEEVKTVLGVVAGAWAAIKALNVIRSITSVIGVVRKIVTAVGGIGPVIAALANPVTLIVAAVAAAAVAIIMNWDKIKEAWGVAVEFFKGVWAGITEAFKNVGSWISEKFKSAWEGVKSAWSKTKDFFSKKWSDIKDAMKNVGSWFKDKFTTAKENSVKAWNNAGEKFGAIRDGIKKKFENIGSWFSTTFSNAKVSAYNAFVSIGSKFAEIRTSIINVFRDLPKNFVTIGKNLLTGLGNGIVEGAKGVIEKAKSVASSVVSGVMGIFGENSPSKVFHKIGGYLMEGMANGIDSNLGMVEDAMDEMGDVVYSEAPATDFADTTTTTTSFGNDGSTFAVPRSSEPRQLTVVLELNRTVLGRMVYEMNNEEAQRVGVQLAGGFA